LDRKRMGTLDESVPPFLFGGSVGGRYGEGKGLQGAAEKVEAGKLIGEPGLKRVGRPQSE
jgi:hypothetical protein